MATPAVDPQAVKDFYAAWTASGKPRIAEFAKQQGKDETTTRRWLNKYAVALGAAAEDAQAARQGLMLDAA